MLSCCCFDCCCCCCCGLIVMANNKLISCFLLLAPASALSSSLSPCHALRWLFIVFIGSLTVGGNTLAPATPHAPRPEANFKLRQTTFRLAFCILTPCCLENRKQRQFHKAELEIKTEVTRTKCRGLLINEVRRVLRM